MLVVISSCPRLSRASTSYFPGTAKAWMAGTNPAMTSEKASTRPHPVAVESIGHAVAEMHQRRRAGLDIARIEHREIAGVGPRAPHHGEQPAVAFGCVLLALDEHPLRDRGARGQMIFAEPPSLAVYMGDAAKAAADKRLI